MRYLHRRNPGLAKLEVIALARTIYHRTGSVLKTVQELSQIPTSVTVNRKTVTLWVQDLISERDKIKGEIAKFALRMRKRGLQFKEISEEVKKQYPNIPWIPKSPLRIAQLLIEKAEDGSAKLPTWQPKGHGGRPDKIEMFNYGPRILALRNQHLSNREIYRIISMEIQAKISEGTLPASATIEESTLKRFLRKHQITASRVSEKWHFQLMPLYQQGLTDKQLCDALNISRVTVERWRKANALPSNRNVRLDRLKPEVIRLRSRGMSVLAISKKLGMSRNGINKMLEES